jgi:hypothetical protein
MLIIPTYHWIIGHVTKERRGRPCARDSGSASWIDRRDGLARRQHGQDPRAIAISWRAQRRVHQRWQVLAGQRRKPAGVVAIACARELAAFCWEAATLS